MNKSSPKRTYSIMLVIMGIISLVVVTASAVYTGLLVHYRTDTIIKQADARLLEAAELNSEILGSDYHDRIVDAGSVSKEEFSRIVAKNDDLCRRLNLQYLWSVLLVNGRLVFTSATHSGLNEPNSACAAFFETHRDPEAFAPALQPEMQPAFCTFKNEWGEGRQVLIPHKDARGRTYIFGASVQMDDLNAVVSQTILGSIVIGLGILCGAFLLALILARSFTAPIAKLTAAAGRMATGDLDVSLPQARATELQSLAQSLDVMRRELKKQLASLRQNEALLAHSQQIANIGSWDLAVATNRLIWSDETYRIFGIAPQEFAATYEAFLDAVHPDDRATVDEVYSRSLRERTDGYEIEHRVVRRSTGEIRHVYEKCVHERNEDGEVVRSRGMVQDITERKQLEKTQQAKNAELERFTYSVSHDLKSPLVTIRTFIGHLADDIARGDKDRMAQDFDFINAASLKMVDLLDELLHLLCVGRAVNPPVEAPLHELVNEALALTGGRIDEQVVKVKVTQQQLTLYGDRVRLVEVFQNLLDNAVKFMGDQKEPLIEIGAEMKGRTILCFVRDNGMGIDPQYKDKLFCLFEKFYPELEGTGIGLALVKRIIELHGGRIWVESEGLGTGACFWFTLPVNSPE